MLKAHMGLRAVNTLGSLAKLTTHGCSCDSAKSCMITDGKINCPSFQGSRAASVQQMKQLKTEKEGTKGMAKHLLR